MECVRRLVLPCQSSAFTSHMDPQRSQCDDKSGTLARGCPVCSCHRFPPGEWLGLWNGGPRWLAENMADGPQHPAGSV
jgi:hypothetical protein